MLWLAMYLLSVPSTHRNTELMEFSFVSRTEYTKDNYSYPVACAACGMLAAH